MMRLRRLDLTRFGHFTDQCIDLGPARPGGSDFHIIYGPNEAGKTTLMEAYLRLIYGFPMRDGYGFKHPLNTLQVGGLAPAAARYAGFSSRRALWTALGVSGAMAGLAGALEAAGPLGQLSPYVPAGYGFAAIIVAYVGRLHPVGIVFSGILMSMFYIGGELAQSRMGLPKSLTGVFQGLLLFTLLACDTLIHYRLRWRWHWQPRSPGAMATPIETVTNAS